MRFALRLLQISIRVNVISNKFHFKIAPFLCLTALIVSFLYAMTYSSYLVYIQLNMHIFGIFNKIETQPFSWSLFKVLPHGMEQYLCNTKFTQMTKAR